MHDRKYLHQRHQIKFLLGASLPFARRSRHQTGNDKFLKPTTSSLFHKETYTRVVVVGCKFRFYNLQRQSVS